MTTLASSLLPGLHRSLISQIALVLAGVVLLAASARVQVPFWPVPMTLQTAIVLLIGTSYGMRLAGATITTYLAAGAVGLPVFAGGAGLAYMVGPTGGYLAGFLAAVLAMGYLSDKGIGRSLAGAIGLMLLGQILIFGLGVGWLAGLIGLDKAIFGGLLPFLPAEILKTALAAALLRAGWTAAARL